jgi:small basic protein
LARPYPVITDCCPFSILHTSLKKSVANLISLNSGVQHPVARVSIRFINVTTVRNYFSFALFSLFTTCFGLYRGHLQVCIDNNIEESPLIFNGSVVFTMSYFSVLFHFSIFKFYHVVIQLYIN